VGRKLGNRAQELEELGGVNERVGDRRALDDALLGQFGTKVATFMQALRSDDREGDVMLDATSATVRFLPEV